MKLEFESYEEGLGGELKCPSCGGNCLQHDKVEVFECGEDAEKGIHVIVESGLATMDTDLTGNPSRRRHGLTVQFWCEGCKAKPLLSISQHKGNTWVNFK
jgi:hypothetical protein